MSSSSSSSSSSPPSLIRWYVDTRLFPQGEQLPLLSALRQEDQETVKRFFHLADRQMSLASNLLKYLFVHRSARIPWSEVAISRTPKPHRRPYWAPTAGYSGGQRLEFNVSHQAGLVTLIGCSTPSVNAQDAARATIPVAIVDGHNDHDHPPEVLPQGEGPQVGIDITCTQEPGRKPQPIRTKAEFERWVDIFSEAFGPDERADIKAMATTANEPDPSTPIDYYADVIRPMQRRFYTFFALKEAYIKMVGEGLLAAWLQDLEFRNVVAPPIAGWSTTSAGGVKSPDDPVAAAAAAHEWGQVEAGFEIWLAGTKVDDVEMQLASYGDIFIVATAVRGLKEPPPPISNNMLEVGTPLATTTSNSPMSMGMVALDLHSDITACAQGNCNCLS